MPCAGTSPAIAVCQHGLSALTAGAGENGIGQISLRLVLAALVDPTLCGEQPRCRIGGAKSLRSKRSLQGSSASPTGKAIGVSRIACRILRPFDKETNLPPSCAPCVRKWLRLASQKPLVQLFQVPTNVSKSWASQGLEITDTSSQAW